MSVIVTRAGKGAPLSWVEADANFTNLNNNKLEAGTPATNIAVTPTNGILATNVQSALAELDTEKASIIGMNLKAPIASPVFTGSVTAPQYYNVSGSYGALQVSGVDVLRFGSDASGQLAGFRNILINGDMRINQRGVTIAAAANGAYGPDRWKKVDASNMTQIVEAGNFEPSTIYTLSGTGVTTQQITSPASGNWTLPKIPIAATKIQLEKGSIATPFELRPIGFEFLLSCRYFYKITSAGVNQRLGLAQMYSTTQGVLVLNHPVPMRAAPTVLANGLYMSTAVGSVVLMNIFISTSSAAQLSATITGADASFVAGNVCLVTFTAAGSFVYCDAEL